MKANLYKFNGKHVDLYHHGDNRKVAWFDDKLIICYLNLGNNWMRAYLLKHIEKIKREASSKGFRFLWTEDRDLIDFADLPIVNNVNSTVQDEISHYLFCHRNAHYGLFRRLDDDHFIEWDYEDIVRSSVNITFPKELYEALPSAEQYGEPIDVFNRIISEETSEEDNIVQFDFCPDPNNPADDVYFQQVKYKCYECDTNEIYKIEKKMDFYEVLDHETKCARCKKDSREVCSGTLIYYKNTELLKWKIRYISIRPGTGYCLDCKPYYVSKLENLVFKCNCTD